jgi:hypothetical protein
MQFLGTGKYGWAQMVMAGDGWKRPEISPNRTTRPFSARSSPVEALALTRNCGNLSPHL